MKKNYTKLIFYVSIASMLIAIGALILFFKIIENKNKHIGAVTATLEGKIKDKEHSAAIAMKMTEVDTVHSNVGSHFVDGAQIDSFVEYLEKIGSDFGMAVKVENFEIPETEEKTMFVRLSTEGKFTNIMHIIKLLENTQYQIHITKVLILKDRSTNTDSLKIDNPKKAIEKKPLEWKAMITFSILTS